MAIGLHVEMGGFVLEVAVLSSACMDVVMESHLWSSFEGSGWLLFLGTSAHRIRCKIRE